MGFYKRASGKASITWPESVDAALCYGWIDGVRNSIDEVSYRIRFTPRKPTSTWSAVNVKRVAELTKLGLMRPAGTKAFEARKGDKTGIYAYEQRRSAQLGPKLRKAVPGQEEGLGVFSVTATMVPAYGSVPCESAPSRKRQRQSAWGIDTGFRGGLDDQGVATDSKGK